MRGPLTTDKCLLGREHLSRRTWQKIRDRVYRFCGTAARHMGGLSRFRAAPLTWHPQQHSGEWAPQNPRSSVPGEMATESRPSRS